MQYKINSDYSKYKDFLEECILNFDSKGETFGNQKRNSLKLFSKDELVINIKSFKIPNIFNQIAYRFFRKSKAQRSFEYGLRLKELGVGTPSPIAYYEFGSWFFFRKSFYISKQLKYDLTYRELINDFEYEDYDNILRQFVRFTFELHEKDIEFLDHSPGNTLITKTDKGYSFALVDLNRMKFGTMDFDKRMKNFARLSKYKHMVEIMSDEYARCINKPYKEVFDAMWKEVIAFRAVVDRKKKLKKTLRK